MADDGLASAVAKTPASMILTAQDKQVIFFFDEYFKLHELFYRPQMIGNYIVLLYMPKIN